MWEQLIASSVIICVIHAGHHGCLTKIESQQKSGVHLEAMILLELNGKATQLNLVQNAIIRLTIVM